jgi:hypothetical protein
MIGFAVLSGIILFLCGAVLFVLDCHDKIPYRVFSGYMLFVFIFIVIFVAVCIVGNIYYSLNPAGIVEVAVETTDIEPLNVIHEESEGYIVFEEHSYSTLVKSVTGYEEYSIHKSEVDRIEVDPSAKAQVIRMDCVYDDEVANFFKLPWHHYVIVVPEEIPAQ